MENGGRKMTKSQETGPSLPEAMRFLAHEKSAAKQYAVILSTIAKNEAAQYVRGIEFYAAAKSEFDGLIAQLRIELQTGQEPAKSVKFNQAMQSAAEKRIAFTSFVSSEVDKLPGARPGLEDLITGGAGSGKGDHRGRAFNLERISRGPQGTPRCNTERTRAHAMAAVRGAGDALTGS
jgi:hypothetical protein